MLLLSQLDWRHYDRRYRKSPASCRNGGAVVVVGYHEDVIGIRLTMKEAVIVNEKQIIAEEKLYRIYKVIGS